MFPITECVCHRVEYVHCCSYDRGFGSGRQVREFDVSKEEYTSWSRSSSDCFPEQWLRQRGCLRGVSCQPGDGKKVFLHSEHAILVINRAQVGLSFATPPPSPLPTLKGDQGCLMFLPLSGISGLLFDSSFLPPVLFFCLVLLLFLSCHFSANGPFSYLLSMSLCVCVLHISMCLCMCMSVCACMCVCGLFAGTTAVIMWCIW